MTTAEMTRVQVVDHAGGPGPCELCATFDMVRGATIVVTHERGGSVQLAACARCVQAVRRLAATVGRGHAVFGTAHGLTSISSLPVELQHSAPALDAEAQLIQEYQERLVDSDGTEYAVRACGQPRRDRTWIGWLEFLAVGRGAHLVTPQETSQPGRAALVYWASGLQPLYLEGAFRRAQPLHAAERLSA